MTKKPVFLILSLLLAGCSLRPLPAATRTIPPPAPAVTDTATETPSAVPSFTPTPATPTYTNTPTLIFNGPTVTETGTPEPTNTPIPIFPTDALSFGSTSPLFTSIKVSGAQLFWGACEPKYIKFTITVSKPISTFYVLLFMKLKAKTTTDGTEWGAGAIMDNDHKGTFRYTVRPESLNHFNQFPSAWLQFQLVATRADLTELGRTQTFLQNLSIGACP